MPIIAQEVPGLPSVMLRRSGLLVAISICVLCLDPWHGSTDALVSSGGTERPSDIEIPTDSEDDRAGPYAIHAGNVPLVWMRREAADKGLVFKSKEFTWDPEDVDFGTRGALTSRWR